MRRTLFKQLNKIKSLMIYFKTLSFVFICYSCCKYPSEHTITLKFVNFDFSKLDSVLLIKINKGDLKQQIDTTLYNLSNTHSIDIIVYEDNSINHSFIIKDTRSRFEHVVTDIHSATYKASVSSSMCQEWKFKFKLDSTDYGYDYDHEVTIKP